MENQDFHSTPVTPIDIPAPGEYVDSHHFLDDATWYGERRPQQKRHPLRPLLWFAATMTPFLLVHHYHFF